MTCEFKWFGLQTKVESFILQTEKRLFTNFHRQVFCWTDKWHGMTMADIRALEDKTKEELEKKRAEGEVCGTKPLNNWRWSEKEEASNETKIKAINSISYNVIKKICKNLGNLHYITFEKHKCGCFSRRKKCVCVYFNQHKIW